MYTTTTIIHYNRHLVLRQEFGKYKWRGKEFDTEEQAFKAIDDKITHFKNKNMEQKKFKTQDYVSFLLDGVKINGKIIYLDDFNKIASIRYFDGKNYRHSLIPYGTFEHYQESLFDAGEMQKKFEWTDELVAEFTTWPLTKSPTFQGRYADIEQFKASKTKPKEYEILEFSVDYLGDSNIVFYKLTEPNVYRKKGTDFPIWFDILNTQKEKSFKIKSVRRTSDNAVFTVNLVTEQGKITKIDYRKETGLHIYVNTSKLPYDYPYKIQELQIKKQPILTTHDGKDIFELDKCWYVGKEFEINEWVAFETEILHLDKLKYFSTKEAAEQYITLNKHCLSVNESLKAYPAPIDIPLYNELKQNLIELAKSKTKQ